jgi:hypothetical protein
MPLFDWRNSTAEADFDIDRWGVEQWEALAARYDTATGAIGMQDWTDFVTQVRESEGEQRSAFEREAELRSTLDTLVQQLRQTPAIWRPTVFVSHQRLDAPWAERAAWTANEAHLDYWLDIHDPKLTATNTSLLSSGAKSVLIAGFIEMALANSTHVVSMQTVNAQQSRWVPYEFGRAKERRLLANSAASWFENGVAPGTNGDYLFLAFCATTSTALEARLNAAGHTSPPRPKNRWPRPVPKPRPN